MSLSPEERKKIYEEEKARIEAREHLERERKSASSETSSGLTPNIAGLLCYLGGWVTGLIFFIIEQTNRTVRFHAAQSIILFGSLTVLGSLFGLVPFVGNTFSTLIGIAAFIFWVILMVKAYSGEVFRLGVIADLADRMVGPMPAAGEAVQKTGESGAKKPAETELEAVPVAEEKPAESVKEASHSPIVNFEHEIGRKVEEYFSKRKGGRIASSAFTIAFSIAALIFFNYFNDYVAYYSSDTVNGVTIWTRTPFFTNDIDLWLPVVTTALIVAIACHVIMIIFDRYILREGLLIMVEVFSLGSAITLTTIFPFNFYAIPSTSVAEMVDFVVHIVLICVCVGIGIGIMVRGIKLLVNLVKGVTSYESGA